MKISAQMLGTARLSKRRKERKDQTPGITVVWSEGPLQVKESGNFSSADCIFSIAQIFRSKMSVIFTIVTFGL
jgi:hypothetical protein